MTLVATLQRTLGRLLKPLMVICALALVVGPAADSIICGFEAVEAGSAQLLAEIPDDPGQDDGAADHAICAHGHCHHPAPLTGSTEVDAAAVLYAGADQPALLALEPSSTSPSSLKRPPRV